MTVIAAVANNMGMMFGGRRVSQDRVLRQYIFSHFDTPIRMSSYSARQFKDFSASILVCENPLTGADKDDVCFVEDTFLYAYKDQIQTIILCRWNRDYPADIFFEIDLSNYDLISSEEICGSSHEKITIEIYRKQNAQDENRKE